MSGLTFEGTIAPHGADAPAADAPAADAPAADAPAADAPAADAPAADAPAADAPAAGTLAAGSSGTVAAAFVEARRPDATRLGSELADLIGDPLAFADALRAGYERLADPGYREEVRRLAPGIGPVLGVRQPLQTAVRRAFERELAGVRASSLLYVADALLRVDVPELHWFAIQLLERIVRHDPERAWQLLRRIARHAGEWITVDTLAHAYGRGILLETYRWAELEQLVYSHSRWERRLVGSTVATIPFVDRRAGRERVVAERSLALVGELIGDAEPDVQKALSWALRNLTYVDREAVGTFCAEQALLAAETGDGLRAWVVRDTLSKLEPALAAELRARLLGLRRRPGAPPTSRAAQTAGAFEDLPDARLAAEPPL